MQQEMAISWLNKILLISSIGCATLCLIIEKFLGLLTLSIIWSLIVIIASTWLCCYLLKSSLKFTAPIFFKPCTDWLIDQLNTDSKNIKNDVNYLQKKNDEINENDLPTIQIEKFAVYIEENFIKSWYGVITNDETFPKESKKILKQLLDKIVEEIYKINGVTLIRKIADILLANLKEFRRSLRRIEKGTSKNLNDAYKYSHMGSKSPMALEYTLYRLVTLIAREVSQRDLINSLPGKFMISVLSKQLLSIILEVSKPQWIFSRISNLLKPSNHSIVINETILNELTLDKNLPIDLPIDETLKVESKLEILKSNDTKLYERPSNFNNDLSLLSNNSRIGLWADSVQDTVDERNSPVYEEPTDFETTIERLRNLLHEKGTNTGQMQVEDSSYEVCERSQFLNLAIIRTEFNTAPDGSQQLLYCIQFDDIEQHGECAFERTTTIVRRKYSDFVQLHSSLVEDLKNKSIFEINLPDGGRAEMEMYLRALCIRLGDSSIQLRHFLKPSISPEKKADAIVPRFDGILAKTVNGVFNTLKTVVPVFEINDEEIPLPTLMSLADVAWKFVEDIKGPNLVEELEQLMAERSDYCSVDTAYEAVEAVEETEISQLFLQWWDIKYDHPYDDEVDEIDGNLTMTCIAIDLICEILGGCKSSNTFRQEAVVRWFKLFFGSYCEKNYL